MTRGFTKALIPYVIHTLACGCPTGKWAARHGARLRQDATLHPQEGGLLQHARAMGKGHDTLYSLKPPHQMRVYDA